ncbi:uncharacterized protein [Antedon mediterranea]|uniref:uncharacterized protein n=1 Tax=Antedon mediterranea TaxID=105859 RepID=UPI003AF9E914
MFKLHLILILIGLCLIIMVLSTRAASSDVCLHDVCHFHLNVRHHRTMTYTGSDGKSVPVSLEENGDMRLTTTWSYSGNATNGSVVTPDEVITGDGVVRRIIVVNGEFPGPTLEVLEGTKVAVKVTNLMTSEVVSIHWHGMHMTDNMWADGAAYVSQCPILPRQSFTYTFIADPAGTHWYHGHVTTQLADGLYGALIVHKRPPVTPSRVLMVANWFHEDYITFDVESPYRQGWKGVGDVVLDMALRDYAHDGTELNAMRYKSALINGKGRIENNAPWTTYTILQDEKMKFHVINTGGEYAFRLSIDCHNLKVVATDGFDIKPIRFQSIIVFPGETYDVVPLRQSKASCHRLANSWIRAERLKKRSPDDDDDDVKAVIKFSDGNSDIPTSKKENCRTRKHPCKVLNCPFDGYPEQENIHCFSIADLKADVHDNGSDLLITEPDEEIFLNVGFNVGSSINCRVFENPRAPFYPHDKRNYNTCDEKACNDNNYCLCSNIIDLPLNATIQLVVTDYSFKPWPQTHHPFHLHGHSFAVLEMGFAALDKSSGRMLSQHENVECLTEDCCQTRWSEVSSSGVGLNVKNPPMKNTLAIPSGGYAVIRFRTNNPGWWLFHCHHASHFMEGMSLLFSVSPDSVKDPVGKFSICPDF